MAIFIRHSIRAQFLNLSNIKGSFDVTGVCILGEEKTINVIVVCRRPGMVERDGAWGEIIRCVDRNESLILVGDFNAHHTAWNCDNIDVNGERMLEEFEDEDMFVVNYDTLSRIGELGQRSSNLDLVWCNSTIADVVGCRLGKDSWGSDHYPVFFECNLTYKLYEKKTNRITSRRTDWKRYVGILEDRECELETEEFVRMGEEIDIILWWIA